LSYASAHVQFKLRASEVTKELSGDYYESYSSHNACGKVVNEYGIDIKKKETRFKDSN